MNKQIPIIVATLSVVAAAGGITFGVSAANQRKETEQEVQSLREQLANVKTIASIPTPATDEGTNATALVALKDSSTGTNDVASLQERLATQDAELERLRAELEATRNNQRQPRQSFQDRMAQLKEEDPERYAEMVQRRTERQQQMRYDQANRLASFMEMDTSNMTAEELANHNLLVEKLSNIWSQTEEFDPEQAPDREAMRAVFDTMREVQPLMEQERTTMFKQLGSDVGLNASEAADFSAYIEDIYSATTLQGPRGGPPRGDRNGGTGGGAPGQ